jgi:hypothetical protein
LQPSGVLIGLGTSPSSTMRLRERLVSGSGSGWRKAAPRIRMARLAVQRGRFGDLDDAAQIHHAHAVGDMPYDAQVMRDEQIREASFC